MLVAAIEDFASIDGVEVHTTWDERLGQQPFDVGGACVTVCRSSEDELRCFNRFARECDRTFVIAPEFDDLLAERRRIVDNVGGNFLGPSLDAIELCADKLRLAEVLTQFGVSTIPTTLFDPSDIADMRRDTAYVIKPRFGAGSQFTYLSSQVDLEELANCPMELIRQPFVEGEAMSLAVINNSETIHVLPLAKQRLSEDGRFHYLGSEIPSTSESSGEVQRIVQLVSKHITGLSGYWGVDLIRQRDENWVVVEINPRLTSSYLAYRELACINLAQLMLDFPTELKWSNGSASYYVS